MADALHRGQDAGLTAAGYSMRNAVLRELRGGYRSSLGNHGDFVTGTSLNHVTVSDVKREGRVASIGVGTDLLYNLFWEVGHHNLFTRRFERDQKWEPAYQKGKDLALARFIAAFKREIFRAGGGGQDRG